MYLGGKRIIIFILTYFIEDGRNFMLDIITSFNIFIIVIYYYNIMTDYSKFTLDELNKKISLYTKLITNITKGRTLSDTNTKSINNYKNEINLINVEILYRQPKSVRAFNPFSDFTHSDSTHSETVQTSDSTHSETFKSSVIQSTATILAKKLIDEYFSEQMDVANVCAPVVVAQNCQNCQICGKSAYPQTSITFERNIYHKPCFKCTKCSQLLDLKNARFKDGFLNCKRH